MQGKTMRLGKAIYTKRTPVLLEGCWARVSDEIDVRVMAIAEGYAMVRRPGAMPFVARLKDLSEKVR